MIKVGLFIVNLKCDIDATFSGYKESGFASAAKIVKTPFLIPDQTWEQTPFRCNLASRIFL
jgi:hypothetical protein